MVVFRSLSLSSWLSLGKQVWHKQIWRRCCVLALLLLLAGCSLPQVKAEDRIFLPLAVDFLGEYRLPKQDFDGMPVGGLSGITYDRQTDRFYAISDDRSERGPARFYTLKLQLGAVANPAASPEAGSSDDRPIGITSLEIERVTRLSDEAGEPFAAGTIDLEGIALSPRRSLYIASEGVADAGIKPFIDEFDLETGQRLSRLPIPPGFTPQTIEGQAIGVQDNQGFESLTINANGSNSPLEPFRLFTATESSLQQDLPLASEPASEAASPSETAVQLPIRLLHYLVGQDQTILLSEHLYQLEPPIEGTLNQGLSDLLTLDQAGHFLSLERSFGINGFGIKLFQLATGGATDISAINTLRGDLTGVAPIFKRLLLDLSTLNLPLDNLEGLAIGPRLPDGSQSLLLLSDDNFNDLQVTQALLFRLRS